MAWEGRHHEFMKMKGVSWVPLSATPSIVKSAWFQLCTQREKADIALAMEYKPTVSTVDVSQRIDRTSIETGGRWPTSTPNQHF